MVREIRDDLERPIVEFIETRPGDIRLPDLDREFAPDHSAEEIRACTDAILERYDEAPVRSMVAMIAYREARECLRDGRCSEVLAAG